MGSVLHLLKGGDSRLAAAAIAGQVAAGDRVTVDLLHGAPAPALPPGVRLLRVPDDLPYAGLLEAIFEADQVVAW